MNPRTVLGRTLCMVGGVVGWWGLAEINLKVAFGTLALVVGVLVLGDW